LDGTGVGALPIAYDVPSAISQSRETGGENITAGLISPDSVDAPFGSKGG